MTVPSTLDLWPSASGTSSVADPSTAVAVEARRLRKVYGDARNPVLALDDIDLTVRRGEFLCLVGASGCGKSTLLNVLAGLDAPTAGSATIRGRSALMFQEAALFPWLTAAGNVDLALRLRKVPRRRRGAEVAQLLGAVRLEDFAGKRPHQLSGGMRQRVALARAFAQDADVLLMDEPFGALDAMTRDLLHDELERLWRERGLTVVFVTHNVREAVRLGDRVIVLTSRPGRIAHRIDVDLPRPRVMDSPDVAELAGAITQLLRKEVRSHARDHH